jgi:hypothetical protein
LVTLYDQVKKKVAPSATSFITKGWVVGGIDLEIQPERWWEATTTRKQLAVALLVQTHSLLIVPGLPASCRGGAEEGSQLLRSYSLPQVTATEEKKGQRGSELAGGFRVSGSFC